MTIPANITGLALIQCRMVAGIAHLRGYDLDDPRVRNAILACLLGEDAVTTLVKRSRSCPAPPMAMATAPAHDPDLDRVVCRGGRLRAGHPGRRQAAGDHRRPAGARASAAWSALGADGYATWRIGRYADRELLPRAPAVDLQQPARPGAAGLAAGARPSRRQRYVGRR